VETIFNVDHLNVPRIDKRPVYYCYSYASISPRSRRRLLREEPGIRSTKHTHMCPQAQAARRGARVEQMRGVPSFFVGRRQRRVYNFEVLVRSSGRTVAAVARRCVFRLHRTKDWMERRRRLRAERRLRIRRAVYNNNVIAGG